MLILFTLLVTLVVAYYHWGEGLFTAAGLLVCVLLAGLVTFNFWEPVANLVESGSQGHWSTELKALNVHFVLLAREVDWANYQFLDSQVGLVQIGVLRNRFAVERCSAKVAERRMPPVARSEDDRDHRRLAPIVPLHRTLGLDVPAVIRGQK